MSEDGDVEYTEFQTLILSRVMEVTHKYYPDLDDYDQIPLGLDAQWAIEGRPDMGPFSKNLYSGPNWAEDFFRDHPEFKKILEDPEIKAVRENDQEWQKIIGSPSLRLPEESPQAQLDGFHGNDDERQTVSNVGSETGSIIDKLEGLIERRNNGEISADEFKQMKKEILGK